MSMPNLLPWRRQQRNQRLRFWGLLFAASLLVMLAGGFSLRGAPASSAGGWFQSAGDAVSRVTGVAERTGGDSGGAESIESPSAAVSGAENPFAAV